MDIGFSITYAYCEASALPDPSERERIEEVIRDDLWAASDRQTYWPMHMPRVRSVEKDGEWLMEFSGRLYISVPEKITPRMALSQLVDRVHLLSPLLCDRFNYQSAKSLL